MPLLPELDSIKNNLKLIDQCYKHLQDKNTASDYVGAYKYTFSRFGKPESIFNFKTNQQVFKFLRIDFAEDWTGPLNYFRNLPFYRLDSSNLRQIDVRCLLITGNSDDMITLESVVKTTEYIQKYYIKVIDGTGHYPHQEDPQKVNEALLDFLLGINFSNEHYCRVFWRLNVLVFPTDPPLVRIKKEPHASQGIFSRMFESVSDSLRYSSKILSDVKNDPHVKTASVITKSYLSTE